MKPQTSTLTTLRAWATGSPARRKARSVASLPQALITAAAAFGAFLGNAGAQNWTPTAGGTYDWNDSGNWSATFPNAIGAAANISADFTGAQNINLNQAITVGSLTINDTGASSDSAVTIAPNGGSLTFQVGSGNASLTSSSVAMNTISASIAVNSNLTIHIPDAGVSAGGITLNGNLSGSGTITRTGNNSSLILRGDNSSFTGKWILSVGSSGGILNIAADNNLGAVPGAPTADFITVTNNNLLRFANSMTINANRGIFINRPTAGHALFLDTVGATTIAEIAGNISGNGGVTRNTNAANAAVVLSGVNTYTGATSVNQGVLRAGSTTAFGNNSAVVMGTGGNARLDLNGFNNSIGSLAGGSASAGNVTLGTATLITGGDDTSTSYAGVISGSGGFTKVGIGTQTLTGDSTYTGATTVNEGTLLVNGSLGNTAVTVNSDATFGGSGLVAGTVSVASDGTLAPGAGIGSLATGSVNFASGATFALEINTDLGTIDLLNVTGNLSITGGAILTLSDLGSDAELNTTLTIINYSGSWNGGFFTYDGNELADGASFTYGTNIYTIDYNNGSAVTLAVSAVPEPGTAVLVGVAFGCVLLGRRRGSFRI